MYPSAFAYQSAASFPEAVALLQELGSEAKVLAGGCSLIPLMKLRLAEPAQLVDLGRIPDAAYITESDGELRIGALTREAEIETASLVAERYPILADASSVIADPTVRNMGTIGGNLAHGDPANDHPAVMLALRASFVVLGPDGERVVPADDFFVDLFQTTLAPTEVLTAVRVPAPRPGSGAGYVKFERQVGDFAIAAAAAAVRLQDGRVAEASIALTNAGPTVIRAATAEASLAGRAPDEVAIHEAADAAIERIEPWADLRGGTAIKRRMTGVAVQRALRLAVRRASRGER
jgi:carbon-monoxide dehydrogenase medium subunit